MSWKGLLRNHPAHLQDSLKKTLESLDRKIAKCHGSPLSEGTLFVNRETVSAQSLNNDQLLLFKRIVHLSGAALPKLCMKLLQGGQVVGGLQFDQVSLLLL